MNKDYQTWRKEMAMRRKVCLACELEVWLKTADADAMSAAQPCADPHEGPFCKTESFAGPAMAAGEGGPKVPNEVFGHIKKLHSLAEEVTGSKLISHSHPASRPAGEE